MPDTPAPRIQLPRASTASRPRLLPGYRRCRNCYYANYLKFAERARSEWLREIGGDEAKAMKAGGLLFVVRRCEIDYRQPARLDDLLEVATRVVAFAGATLDLEQVVRRDDADLVVMQVTLACLNSAGRPARLPAALRAALATLLPA